MTSHRQKEDWEQGELMTKGIINGWNSYNLIVVNSAVAAVALAVVKQADQSVMTAA